MADDPLQSAISLATSGRFEEAKALLQQCVADEPDNASALNALGVISHQQGSAEGAESWFRRAVEADRDDPKYQVNLGSVLIALNRAKESLPLFEQALRHNPDDQEARYNQALAFGSLGQKDAAEQGYRRLLKNNPDHISALNNLGIMLLNTKGDEAEQCLRRVLEIDPKNFDARCNLILCLERRNALDEAAAVAEALVADFPESPEANVAVAKVQRRQGNHEAAIERLKAHSNAERSDIRVDALFQLGKSLDSVGRSAEAYDAFTEANKSLAASAGPDIAEQSDAYEAGIRAMNRALSLDDAPLPRPGSVQARPQNVVFFIGFPRSGTTLFEQVLAAHPDVVTSEENSPFSTVKRRVDEILAAKGVTDPLSGALSLDGNELEELRTRFWDAAARRHDNAANRKWFVDKLPMNLAETVLIDRIFPDAAMIVALRDPRDVCLSCFMQQFTMNAAMYRFHSLESTVAFYELVMGQWLAARDRISIPWIEYRYEDLISDFPAVTTAVLEFVGIPWDDTVLDYRTRLEKTFIGTPSYEGVAEPMSRRAVNRWQSYRLPLEPYLPRLKKYVEVFGYDETETESKPT